MGIAVLSQAAQHPADESDKNIRVTSFNCAHHGLFPFVTFEITSRPRFLLALEFSLQSYTRITRYFKPMPKEALFLSSLRSHKY